jgi:aldose 1-epimerase
MPRPHSRRLLPASVLTATTLAAGLSLAQAASLSSAPYGVAANGEAITQYTLDSGHGVTVRFINYGGIITAITAPDRRGVAADIVLGLPSLQDYERLNGNIHFGALIGRYANRIAAGRFVLDGKTYQLPVNDPPNTLHGGPASFDARVWRVEPLKSGDGAGATLHYTSPDGDNGFPGALAVDVTYMLTSDNALWIDYRATTDRATVVNLTNHSYFNLAGEGSGSVEAQTIQIAASRFTPTDASSIPTGELVPVAGTPMDLRAPTPIGKNLRSGDRQLAWAHGFDHNWVLDAGGGAEPGFAARATDPASGRVLEVYTTQPGLQFYTANGLNGSVTGKSGRAYRQTDAFALEAEHFPDSPNRPSFPGTVLRPGERFHEVTIFRFRTQ